MSHDQQSTTEDPRAVLRRHGLRPKRSWGQNFLINLGAVERIAEAVAAHQAVSRAIEIGAGAGTLTAALASRLDEVIAIERDPELVTLLRAERPTLGRGVTIVDADAATFDYGAELSQETAIAGNLPYQITGRLIRRIIEQRQRMAQAVVMVQLEVAQRLVASPGSSSYGVMTVMTQAFLEAELLFRVSPGSFYPRPKVASAVVRLEPSATPRAGGVEEAALSQVVHAAFSARRKTLRNTLSKAFSRERALAALEEEGVDPGLRAEVLSVEQLARLAERLV